VRLILSFVEISLMTSAETVPAVVIFFILSFYSVLAPASEFLFLFRNQAAAGLAVQAKTSFLKVYNGASQLQMDRTVSTVLDVWFEWTEDRGGKPSILDLNQKYGSDWR